MNKIIQGDALDILKTFDSESIDCVITSPPYWRLRDYGHDNQLGLEQNFRDYIENMCIVFDEVKRVIKPEGTCWVNIADTYGSAGGGKGANQTNPGKQTSPTPGMKPNIGMQKSLVQIPSRFAIAMTDRGWILRNEIIWHKPNAMPQSVRDRFTVDYEKIFFFTKSKQYWFEQQFEPWVQRANGSKRATEKHPGYAGKHSSGKNAQGIKGQPVGDPSRGRNKRSVWSISTLPYNGAHFAVFPERLITPMIKAGCPEGGVVLDPFVGSGTTLFVAHKLLRKYIGIEINPDYTKLAEKRLRQGTLL